MPFDLPPLPAVVDEASFYAFDGAGALRTPALVIYADVVDANIRVTISLLGGNADRWRPHVKTSKLAWTMRRLVGLGVRHAKCATTLELATACDAGFDDVLLSYPVARSHVARVREIALAHPHIRVSALVEDHDAVAEWMGAGVGLFVDLDIGMHRTGLDVRRVEECVRVARAIAEAGIELRGLHGYDGHASSLPAESAARLTHESYDALLRVASAVRDSGLDVGEVITAGTPALPHAIAYDGFARAGILHRVSPGTVVYGDVTSLAQLPGLGYAPAAVVLSTVVSRPSARIATCDAGHKAVSADAGVPTCAIVGRPGLRPARPSEEHLPIEVPEGEQAPRRGDRLFLVPRHVCPTVNNFDHAVIVSGGRIVGVERVTARGREAPGGDAAEGPGG